MSIIVDIKKHIGTFTLDVKFETEDCILAILGSSGCGKTMTLKCISGIEKPDEGYIEYNGKVFFNSKKNINIKPQERNTGYLFQNYALFPNMNVIENIKTGIRKNKYTNVNYNLENIIKKFHIEGLENRYSHELSGGEQQRVALARIFISSPEIIMLDEPLSSLDSFTRWSLEQVIIERLKEFNGMSIFVSHDRDEVYRICDNIGILQNGKLETIEEKHKLFENPKNYFTAVLTGCKNFSKVKKISDTESVITDWNIIIKNKIHKDINYAAVRSHLLFDIEYKKNDENCQKIECVIIKIIEDVFSYIIMLKPINSDNSTDNFIRWDIEKNAYLDKYKLGEKITLAFKEKDLMFIK